MLNINNYQLLVDHLEDSLDSNIEFIQKQLNHINRNYLNIYQKLYDTCCSQNIIINEMNKMNLQINNIQADICKLSNNIQIPSVITMPVPIECDQQKCSTNNYIYSDPGVESVLNIPQCAKIIFVPIISLTSGSFNWSGSNVFIIVSILISGIFWTDAN